MDVTPGDLVTITFTIRNKDLNATKRGTADSKRWNLFLTLRAVTVHPQLQVVRHPHIFNIFIASLTRIADSFARSSPSGGILYLWETKENI